MAAVLLTRTGEAEPDEAGDASGEASGVCSSGEEGRCEAASSSATVGLARCRVADGDRLGEREEASP